ncbi:MAG: type IV pilus assembly protein PilM [Verrucomicrobiia bacterium]|jgi:type IV pilus assembly protein PilM
MYFTGKRQNKRDVAVGLDLGASQIKAVILRRKGDALELAEYAVMDSSSAAMGKPGAAQPLAAELQQLMAQFKIQERRASVAISCSSVMVCHAEFPPVPLAEIKSALKLNSSGYLRHDFSSYYLDAFELKKGNKSANGKDVDKTSVLVGGANRTEVDAYRDALVAAKIKPEVIELAAVSVINAFHVSHLGTKDEVVVLVDIGAHMTSINFLLDGMPLITRIMHFGGAQISDYISHTLMLEPHEAEEEKRKMSAPIQELVKTAISPLAREIRSSIDFYERQNDRHIGQIYACGGSACSPQMLAILGEAVGTHVECWNPIQSLDVSRLNGETPRVLALGPSLAAAVGAAAARLA